MDSTTNALTEIGFIRKTHGYKGDMTIRLHTGVTLLTDRPKVVFLQATDQFIPFFVISWRGTTESEAIIHLETLESKEEAAAYKGKALFMNNDEVEVSSQQEAAHELLGYLLEDVELGKVGVIEQVLPYPHQEMLAVRYGDRQVLVPLSDAWIREVDEAGKRIIFELPAGLLDI